MFECLSFAVVPLALGIAAPAFAQDKDAPPQGGDSITIGGGAIFVPDYEGSDHSHITAAPLAIGTISGFNFQVLGNRATVDLIADSSGPGWDFQAGPIAVLDVNRSVVSGIDDRQVRALGKRNMSVEVGGFVGIGRVGVITSQYDRLSIGVSYRKGITGAQRGGIVEPNISYLTPLSRKTAIGLFGSAQRVERKYGAAYFDVSAAGSARSGLPQFRAQGGWKSWTVGGMFTYSLTGDLLHGIKLIAGGTYSRMMNDYADSPIVSIVGNKNQWLGAAGLAWTF